MLEIKYGDALRKINFFYILKRVLLSTGVSKYRLIFTILLPSISYAGGTDKVIKWEMKNEIISRIYPTPAGGVFTFSGAQSNQLKVNIMPKGDSDFSKNFVIKKSMYMLQNPHAVQANPISTRDSLYIPYYVDIANNDNDDRLVIFKVSPGNNYQPQIIYQLDQPCRTGFKYLKCEFSKDMKLSNDLTRLYFFTKLTYANSEYTQTYLNALDLVTDRVLWSVKASDNIGITDSPDGSFLYIQSNTASCKMNAKTGEKECDHAPVVTKNKLSFTSDQSGFVNSAANILDVGEVFYRFSPFHGNPAADWVNKTDYGHFINGPMVFGADKNSPVYGLSNKSITAFERDTGIRLFSVEAPLPIAEPYLFTEKKSTGLFQGEMTFTRDNYGYRTYITHGGVDKKTGVLAISPDGKTKKIIEVPQDYFPGESTVSGVSYLSEPFSAGESLYVVHMIGTNSTIYKFPQSSATEITEVAYINGNDRPPEHRTVEWLVTDSSNKIQESGTLTLNRDDPQQQVPTYWPLLLAEAINSAGGVLQAGEQGEDKNVYPIASQYRNWLWLPADKTAQGWKVKLQYRLAENDSVAGWTLNPGELKSINVKEGDFLPDTICLRLYDRTGVAHNLTLSSLSQESRFMWAKQFAKALNQLGREYGVQAGELLPGAEVRSLASQYRNKFWVAASSKASVEGYIEGHCR